MIAHQQYTRFDLWTAGQLQNVYNNLVRTIKNKRILMREKIYIKICNKKNCYNVRSTKINSAVQ